MRALENIRNYNKGFHYSCQQLMVYFFGLLLHHFPCVAWGVTVTPFTQPAITCSKLTTETLEQLVKYVQS